jgi:hypothetical protein
MTEEFNGPDRREPRGRRETDQGSAAGVDRRAGMDRRRGPGRRRSDLRRAAEEGEMSDEILEFVMAVDEYKRTNNKPFPTWSEVFELIKFLGYRKVAEQAGHINQVTQDTRED